MIKHRGSVDSTMLTRIGRPQSGWANTPIVKGSTYLFDSVEAWRDTRMRRSTERLLSYGARGNETVYALEDAINELEGGFRTKLFPTGLAAIAVTLLAYLKAGDHLLVTESVYGPVRRLCQDQLAKYGIKFDYFDPLDDDWQRCLLPETRMVYVESPGSTLYDMSDLPAMALVCHQRGILLCADNTWGSCLNYHPLRLGCDISIVAATKYLGGHSDVMMGSVTVTELNFADIESASVNFGQTVSADDAYLVLRGLRTLDLRLRQHADSALEIAIWLRQRAEVRTVFHPALPDDPNHDLWLRDANGSNGLLTVEFDPAISTEMVECAINRMRLFGIGSSWGGYESLVLPVNPDSTRLCRNNSHCGYLLRLHIGLEATSDLVADLQRLLEAVN